MNIFISSLKDHQLAVGLPFERRKKVTIAAVNRVDIHMTDCSMTHDHMMETLDKAIILTRDLSHSEMFEVLINLDKKGIDNMYLEIFSKWNHSDVPIWDYRSIERTLKWRYEVLNDKPITRRNYA